MGGCFIRPVESETLGNVQEANPAAWGTGTAALRRRYSGARTVVPGHGAVGGPELLVHTAALLGADRGRAPAAAAR